MYWCKGVSNKLIVTLRCFILQVKADRGNKRLLTLQHASRHVNDMAAVVVTSTKAGQMQIEEKGEYLLFMSLNVIVVQSFYFAIVETQILWSRFPDTMDFSGLSLIKLKTEEMDSQVSLSIIKSKATQHNKAFTCNLVCF